MKRLCLLYAGVLGAMLVLFGLAEALNVPFLSDPDPLTRRGGAVAAVIGVVLLVIDVVLPVPSSVVMVAHGALFGVALGATLSLAGSLGAFGLGFALGRRGGSVIARFVTEDERRRADRLLMRWGAVAIILTRPVPMLAETVAFAAGASSLRWRPAVGAATLGYLPAAGLYAIAGAVAATYVSAAVVFIAVLVLAIGAAVVLRPGRRPAMGSLAP